jgi:hypothetical protein
VTPEDYNADPDYQRMLADIVADPYTIDLGGIWILYHSTSEGERCGFMEVHKRPDGLWCAGGVTFNIPATTTWSGAKWAVNSMEPLDLSPSLLCRSCGNHGFVKQGRWVSC